VDSQLLSRSARRCERWRDRRLGRRSGRNGRADARRKRSAPCRGRERTSRRRSRWRHGAGHGRTSLCRQTSRIGIAHSPIGRSCLRAKLPGIEAVHQIRYRGRAASGQQHKECRSYCSHDFHRVEEDGSRAVPTALGGQAWPGKAVAMAPSYSGPSGEGQEQKVSPATKVSAVSASRKASRTKPTWTFRSIWALASRQRSTIFSS
jgi:hypothetical protein